MGMNLSVTEMVLVSHQSGTECLEGQIYCNKSFFFLYFSDTANGCEQAEHNLASDIPPGSGCSFRSLTPASAHQPPHCKMPTFCIPWVQLGFLLKASIIKNTHAIVLWPRSQIWHTTCLCKGRFIGTSHTHLFLYCLWLLSCYDGAVE